MHEGRHVETVRRYTCLLAPRKFRLHYRDHLNTTDSPYLIHVQFSSYINRYPRMQELRVCGETWGPGHVTARLQILFDETEQSE